MSQNQRNVSRQANTKLNSSDDDEFNSPHSSPPRKQSLIQNTKRNTSTSNSYSYDSNMRTATVASNEINEENIMLAPTEIRIASAETAVKEISNDKLEAQRMIATYGIDPIKILHIVERWTQTMLSEFQSSRFRLKHILKEKWEKQELNVNSNLYNRERTLYEHIKNLERSKQDYLSKTYFDELKTISTNINTNTNVDELKNKIRSIIEKFCQIIESLEFIEQYQGNTSYSNFETTKNVLLKLQVLNDKKSHTICIIGLEKCGKSTFINALLDYKLLPAESERCTQIRTVLKPKLEEEPLLVALVDFYNDDEFQVLFGKMIKKSDEEEQQFQMRKTQVQQKRQQFMVSFPQRKEKLMLSSNGNADIERDKIIKKLHGYITDELCVNIIKEISIYTEKLRGQNYELLDVPGFDSPIKEHRDAGLQSIKTSDAFLFLTDGGRPSLTRDQIRLLDEIQNEKQHYEPMKRAFGIITKLDHCHTANEFNERYHKAKQQLITKGFKESKIFAVCSIINILDKNTDEYRAIIRKIPDFGDLQHGFQRNKEALNQFIELELPKTHLSQLIDLGLTKLSHYVDESLSIAKTLMPSTINFADQGSFDDYVKQENDQKWDKIYNDEFFQPTFEKANIWQKTVLIQERDKFLNEIKTTFSDCFTTRTKGFIDRPVDIQSQMVKQFDYTILHSSSQNIDDQLRKSLSFELEEAVVQTINTLARHLYDEYVSKLEHILNEIGHEEYSDLYRTQSVSYNICNYEIRAVVLLTCRPIIIATLRFSHSDEQCRRAAIEELILIAPTIVCHLFDNNNEQNGSFTQQITSWVPTLKKGIEYTLGVYGKTGIQNKITAGILKMVMKKFL